MAKKDLDPLQINGENAETFESKFRLLFDNLGDEVHQWRLVRSESGKILTWKLEDVNPSALKNWGKRKKDVIGKTADQIFGPGSTDQFMPTVKEIFKTGKPKEWLEYFKSTGQYISMKSIPFGNSFVLIGKDITEEKQVENALKDSRDLLQKAELIANQGSWKWDIKNDRFTFSDNWVKIHGFNSSEIGINDLVKIAHPDDLEKIQSAIDDSLNNKKPYDVEHRIIRQDTGDVRWARANGEVQFSKSGEPLYFMGVGQDITHKHEIEEALNESKEFLNKTGEIAKVGGWALKGDFSTPYWTETTRKIHEVPEDFTPTIENAIEFYHPDDRDLVKTAVERAIKIGESFEIELRLITAKGNQIWVHSIGQPEMEYGKCVRLWGTFQNITERKKSEAALKESEQNFKAIFQNGAVAKILADEKGNYLEANKRACELTGYTEKELTSRSIVDLVKSKSQNTKESYAKFKQKGYESGEVEITRKNGEIRITEYFAKKIGNNKYLSTLIDITDKKRALEELEKSKEKLKNITNSVPGTIYQFKFEKDGSYSIPFMSERASELLGFDYEQMKDIEFLFSRIHPDDFESTLASINEANKDQSLWYSEFRAINAKNEVVWIKGHSFGVKDDEGNIIHNGVFLDITDKKRVEEALKISEQKHRNLADNIPGIALQYKLNPDGSDELCFVSKGVEELYEVSAEEAMANNQLLWNRVHKDELEAYAYSVNESATNLSTWKFEHRIIMPDGRVKWVYMRGIPSRQTDGSTVWDTIGLDITDQKKAEKELELLNNNLEKRVEERTEKILSVSKELELYLLAAEQAESGVWRFDIQNDELIWDDIMYKLYGIDKKQFSGAYEAWESSLHAEDKDRTAQELQDAIDGKKPFNTIFRIIHPRTGKISHIRGKGKVERDKNGKALFVYGTHWDVSREMLLAIEREKALTSLKEAQSHLVQSEKMASLGILTAGVAHEINNPLNYIVGGYTAIEDYINETEKLSDDELKKYLEWIKIGAERASNIVKSLNQFSRSTDNQIEKCDIHAIIEDCILVLQQKHKDRIEIIKKYKADESVISGNNGRLHQAFLNILSNAIDSISEKGKIIIHTKSKNNRVDVLIEDNGCGIGRENYEKITDPFFTTKPPGKGTGLGLSITKSIINEHDGKLSFQSEIDKGTIFTIELPKAEK